MTGASPIRFVHRIGVRVFASMLAVSLGAVLTTVGLLAVASGRALRESISQRNLRTARQVAQETGRLIGESIADLQAIARLVGPLPYADWIRGTLLANVALEFPRFRWVEMVDADGAPVTLGRRSTGATDIPRDALTAARESGVWISPLRLSTDDYTPAVLLCVALRHGDAGSTALAGELRLRDIWALLDEIDIAGTGAAWVMTADGVLLGHTDKRVLLTPAERQRIPPPPADLPAEGAVVTITTTEGPQLTAFAVVPGRGWVVAVAQPVAEAFLPAATLVRQSLLLVVIAAVVAAAVGLLFSRRLSRPLATLANGTRAVAAGDFASRLRVCRPDEVGALAAAFNEMAATLEQRTRDLEASERKYRLTTEYATDLIFSLDARGRCTFASGRIRDISGLSPEEAVGRRLGALLQAPAPADLEPPPGAERHTLLVEATVPDGRRVPLEIGLTRVTGPDGAAAWYGVARDITERRQLEEQLYRAQKMEAVGRLAGGVAHDFNNLLTAILGYGEIALRDARDQPRLLNAIEQISSAGRRAASLTRQLLAFSRRQVLEPQPVDLNRLLAGMEEMLRRLIGERIGLVLRPAPRLGRVHADAGQLEQVVMNLCVNARDAMPDGGELEIATADEGDGRVRISVKDTGTGMPPEVLAHLYEPFFTTKGPGKGTGLGLSTVYGIVRQSGGEISCTSVPRSGTTFTITFPSIDAESPDAAERTSTTPPGGSEKVLVVEDDPALGRLMTGVLRDAGYAVTTVGSAEEARTVFRDDVRALVTDLVLPGTDGRRLAEELRVASPRLAVLMISGYTADTLEDYEALAGSTGFLQKPFMPADLLVRLRTLLDGAG